MSDDLDIQLKREFLAEAAEMLEAVESAFIEFEQRPDDGKVIDKIFRLAHTIKGSALSCGFTDLGEFAHVVETLLVRIREKKMATSPAIVDVLLKANDRLVAYVRALEDDSNAVIETADLVKVIQGLLATKDEAKAPAGPASDSGPGWGLFEDPPPPAAAAPAAAAHAAAPVATWGIVHESPAACAATALVEARSLVEELAAAAFDSYVEVIRLADARSGSDRALRNVERMLDHIVQLRSALRAGNG